MLRSYRGIIVAVAGLALVGVSHPPESKAQPENAKKQTEISQKSDNASFAVEVTDKTDETTKPCAKHKDNRNSDLCAQWKAADAAAKAADASVSAADAAWKQFYLGIGGLIIGFLTLVAAGAAAIYARRAAEHTERGANAALDAVKATGDANEIARDALERQTRAYLRIEIVRGTVSSDFPAKIECKIINYGQTPAFDFSVRHQICIRPSEWKWSDEAESDQTSGEPGSSVLHPGDVREFPMEMLEPLTLDLWDALVKNEVCLFARGEVFYKTTSEKPCRTAIALEFSGNECFRRKAPRLALYGNEAT
jgi:hypothetical protein